MIIERAIKLAVVASTVVFLAAHLAIGRAWSGMAEAATAAFLAFALLARLDRRAMAIVLASSCLLPPTIWYTLETFSVQYWILWIAALLGAMMPDLVTTGWHLAPRWRVPLLLAALAVIVATPIVVARELDFSLGLLGDVPGAVLSGLPWHAVEWVLQVAVTTLVGILWFEWLAGTTDVELEAVCIKPLVLTIAVSASISIYQMLVEVTFLNETVYGAGGRASGALFDANVHGVLSAAAIGLACFVAEGSPRPAGWLASVPVFMLAVWASGSRTAFGAAVLGLVVSWVTPRLSTQTVEARPVQGSGAGLPRASTIGALSVAMLLVIVLALSIDTTTTGPLERFGRMVPGTTSDSVWTSVAELWRRNGYGTASTSLIAQFPWTGVGIGGFHLFGPPLAHVGRLPPDNAQNWLRQHVVEMGLLGGLGWILFAVAFAWALGTTWRQGEPRVRHVRGMLVAFTVISLFGVPTQEVLAAIVFWTAAAFVLRPGREPDASRHLNTPTLVAILMITVVFAGATWQAAQRTLRIPVRARTIGWPFTYGFYDPEPDGSGGTVRWMGRRASALVDVAGPYFHVAIRSPLPNVERDPVDVEAWYEGRRVIQARVTSGEPVAATVAVPPGLRQTLLDVRVSRTVRPRDLDGTADDRELGALVAWTFRGEP